MLNSINKLSPNFRDFLLNRNIIADTIKDNGLKTLLSGIGSPTNIGTNIESVKPSTDIIVDGSIYRDLNIIQNKFQVDSNEYRFVEINTINGSNVPSSVLTVAEKERRFNTTTNLFQGGDFHSRLVDIQYRPSNVANLFNNGTYLDENGNLNLGDGATSNVLDIIGSIAGGGGIGFNPNGGLSTNADTRSSLAGRVLNDVGLLADTRLGIESAKFLKTAILNNVASNIQEETLGRLNLNPLSLLNGGSIIKPDYTITKSGGLLGNAINILEKVSGFKRPVSPIDDSGSIFSFNSTGYVGVSTKSRADSLLSTTGGGQKNILISLLSQNINSGLIGSRVGYAPSYGEELKGNVYAYYNGNDKGDLIDLTGEYANTSSLSNVNREERISNSGFDKGVKNVLKDSTVKDFTWTDGRNNPDPTPVDPTSGLNFGSELNPDDVDFEEFAINEGTDGLNVNFANDSKTILGKTRSLFNSGKVKTLTSGKAISLKEETEIETSIINGFISKGSGVLSEKGLELGETADASEVFCRVWTTFDRYDSVENLQKHEGLNPKIKLNNKNYSGVSVLGDNGFVRIGPYNGDKIKKFMFSIENLAWSNNTQDLTECEIGDGDPLSGKKGRVMWFPPYDMSFNETTSVSYNKSDFIGRGEPIHTYNNTERTGNLSWKIIIDHPNYMNYFKNNQLEDFTGNETLDEQKIRSMIAGCYEIPGFIDTVLTENQKASVEVAQNVKKEELTDNGVTTGTKFDIFFANDVFEMPTLYENGLKNGSDTPDEYTDTEVGENYGIVSYKGSGIVGLSTSTYLDRNNYGLNATQLIKIGKDDEIDGWNSDEFEDGMSQFMETECKFCKIVINGYASSHGESDKNVTLSQKRAESVKKWLIDSSGILPNDSIKDKRVVIDEKGHGEIDSGCNPNSETDSVECKKGRKVTVTFKNSEELKDILLGKKVDKKLNNEQKKVLDKIPLSSLFTECSHFEYLRDNSSFVYETLKSKLKNFHPAFHSITPEGFNSRLTFLQQCTRQGPTDNSKQNATNLTFGRAPICILRLGDFYHTKIVIDSLTFDYENQWDMNPEGSGIQPMIVSVSMGFSFIGGSSMNGPINKLQNAVTFNYFANTEIYDPRADTIKISDSGLGSVIEGSINPSNIGPTSEGRGVDNSFEDYLANTMEAERDEVETLENEIVEEFTEEEVKSFLDKIAKNKKRNNPLDRKLRF